MDDEKKTKSQLKNELIEMRQRYAEMEALMKRYYDLYDNAPVMSISVDAHSGKVLECNQALATTTGYHKEEILDHSVFNLYHTDCIDEAKKTFRSFLQTGKVHGVELQLKRKDGSKIYVSLDVSSVCDDDGNILYSRSFWHDITERVMAERELEKHREHLEELVFERTAELTEANKKLQIEITERVQAEEKARKSEALFSGILDIAKDAIVSVDETQNILIFNKGAERIFRYSSFEIIGKPIDYLIPERFRVNHQSLIKKFVPSKTSANIKEEGPYEIFCLRKNSEEFPAEATISKLEENGKKIYTVVLRDITDRKKMEEELLRGQKLESLGILAGGIAHDFNNILTAILGNISLARMLAKPVDKVCEILTKAEKASLQAKELTQQLLTFSRGGAPIKKATSISELIKDSAEFAISGSNVKCEFSLPDDLWAVDIDEGQISQVVNNLIINAIQAMPKGGVIKLFAENLSEDDAGYIPSLCKRRYVKISFVDQGVGISKELLPNIFDPYFTTKQKGSGLGLASSYSIIKKHGGAITVKSGLDVGTTFYIYLPASSKDVRKKEKVKEAHLIGGGKILVMDDEEIIRNAAGIMLSHMGYEVEFAKDGAEALDLYKRVKESDRPFDVVIMDLTIQGAMGGKEAIKELLKIDPEAKAIVCSGYSNDTVMANFKEYGFKGVITKPFNIQEINEALNKVI